MGARIVLISCMLAIASGGCVSTASTILPPPENPTIVVDDPTCVSCGWLLTATALSQLQQQAGSGNAEAAFRIALHYSSAEDSQQSNLWMRRAALIGHGIAQYNLWFELRESQNCDALVEALSWLEKSAAQGVSTASQQLQSFKQVAAPCQLPPNNSLQPKPLRGSA